MYVYTYIYINNDLLASSPPFNLNIVTLYPQLHVQKPLK